MNPRERKTYPASASDQVRDRCPINGLPQHTCRTARAFFKRQLGQGVRGLQIFRCPHCHTCHVRANQPQLN